MPKIFKAKEIEHATAVIRAVATLDSRVVFEVFGQHKDALELVMAVKTLAALAPEALGPKVEYRVGDKIKVRDDELGEVWGTVKELSREGYPVLQFQQCAVVVFFDMILEHKHG